MITLNSKTEVVYESLGEVLRSDDTWEGKFIWIHSKMVETVLFAVAVTTLVVGLIAFMSGLAVGAETTRSMFLSGDIIR